MSMKSKKIVAEAMIAGALSFSALGLGAGVANAKPHPPSPGPGWGDWEKREIRETGARVVPRGGTAPGSARASAPPVRGVTSPAPRASSRGLCRRGDYSAAQPPVEIAPCVKSGLGRATA